MVVMNTQTDRQTDTHRDPYTLYGIHGERILCLIAYKT